MAPRNKDVYRGRHKRRSMIGGIVFLVVLLMTAAVVIFYSFQKYIVYGQDGISLELPILATPEPTDETGDVTDFPVVNAELVVESPDYSTVEARAGEELTDIRALFVPAESVSIEGLAKYADLLSAYDANALVLELKPTSGALVYPTEVELAVSYGLSGSFDMTEAIAALKERGVYLVAQLSCCADSLLAGRNSPIALKNAYGNVYTNYIGGWLDPYNATVRQYISDLALEAAGMGFDEVLFKHLEQPLTDEVLSYSVSLSSPPTPTVGVSGLAMKLTRDLESTGVRVSVLLNYDALAAEKTEISGQDAELFFKVFDRVCCWSGTAWEYGFYRDAMSQYVTLGEASKRYLPIMSFAPEGATSCIVLVPASVLG